MRKPPRVLFVGPNASRTGAPLLLLNFLRWLAANSDLSFEILLGTGGDLLPEFAALAPTYVLNDRRPQPLLLDLFRRARAKLRLGYSVEQRLRRRYPAEKFPLVYSNTVANGELVGLFGKSGHNIICHAHEMKFGIARWGGKAAKESSGFIQSFIAASESVKRDLMAVWGVPEDKIVVVHEFGQPSTLSPSAQAECRQRKRAELQIPIRTIVVGMCGTVDWRKGADLFPPLAKAVRARAAGISYRFVWVGARTDVPEYLQFVRDCEMLELTDDIAIIGEVRDSQDYMAAFDIFALTSREDPCPLVMLEAASLGLPIVCFAQSGGAPDFVGRDAGRTVPYLDIDAMAGAIIELGADPAGRTELGLNGKNRAQAGFTLQTQAPQLLGVIDTNFVLERR